MPMKKRSIFLFIILVFLFSSLTTLLAVEYPIISLGLNGGWGQSELTKGAFGRIFLRYSLEAYVPGFQVEASYARGFYNSLKDTVILNPDLIVDERTIETKIYDNYPAIAGTFHLRPFGESTIIYFGGGAQIHFLASDKKTTDRYWDEIAEKYQETELDKVSLLNQTKFGYHLLGGLSFTLGGFGAIDLEVRQTFLNVAADDWDDNEARKLWGEKSWNNFSVNVGLTVYIF
jgi:hypothetical protein